MMVSNSEELKKPGGVTSVVLPDVGTLTTAQSDQSQAPPSDKSEQVPPVKEIPIVTKLEHNEQLPSDPPPMMVKVTGDSPSSPTVGVCQWRLRDMFVYLVSAPTARLSTTDPRCQVSSYRTDLDSSLHLIVCHPANFCLKLLIFSDLSVNIYTD